MVPAKGYSERVSNKNLRTLGGKSLVEHVLDTLESVDIPVYLNSDSDEILKLCEGRTCIPYKRDPSLCTDEATNDDFMLDFMSSVDAESVLQVLPTSPFITKDEIEGFIDAMAGCDTLVSVKEERIACVFNDNPVNFCKTEKNPRSQDMEPVLVYATSLMGWKTDVFAYNMHLHGSAYHGGTGHTRYYTLKGLSTIDIDTETDFDLAEVIASNV